jgi:hypothetical protein
MLYLRSFWINKPAAVPSSKVKAGRRRAALIGLMGYAPDTRCVTDSSSISIVWLVPTVVPVTKLSPMGGG